MWDADILIIENCTCPVSWSLLSTIPFILSSSFSSKETLSFSHHTKSSEILLFWFFYFYLLLNVAGATILPATKSSSSFYFLILYIPVPFLLRPLQFIYQDCLSIPLLLQLIGLHSATLFAYLFSALLMCPYHIILCSSMYWIVSLFMSILFLIAWFVHCLLGLKEILAIPSSIPLM